MYAFGKVIKNRRRQAFIRFNIMLSARPFSRRDVCVRLRVWFFLVHAVSLFALGFYCALCVYVLQNTNSKKQ